MPSAQVFNLYPSDLLEFPCESLPGELPAAWKCDQICTPASGYCSLTPKGKEKGNNLVDGQGLSLKKVDGSSQAEEEAAGWRKSSPCQRAKLDPATKWIWA